MVLPLAEDWDLAARNPLGAFPIGMAPVRALATARAKDGAKVRVAAEAAAGARGVSLSDPLA